MKLLANMQAHGQLEKNIDDYQVIILPKCKGIHLYHKECLLQQLNSSSNNTNGEFIKCAVCETTYGKRVGEMPDGEMEWRICNDKC